MKKIKITVTTGTRADYGILRPLLKKIENSKKLELILIVTGSHLSQEHGKTVKEIRKDGFKINAEINIIPQKDDQYNTSIAIGKGIIEFAKCFKKFKPKLNLILGDRYEMLASAISAYHQNILNIHIHGGDKSGGLDEYSRHAITKISNIHFTATKKSASRVIRMGEDPKYVIQTGSLAIDEIMKKRITGIEEINKKHKLKLKGNEIIVLQHSDTNEPQNAQKQILATLNVIRKTKHAAIIIGPNIDTGNKEIIKTIHKFAKDDSIKFCSSLPREDFLGLLKNCKLLIGNSSSGMIEASVFKIPVINIGNRQKNREHGKNVINIKEFSEKKIEDAIKKALTIPKSKLEMTKIYGNGKSAEKIVNYLEKINVEERLFKKEITY
jgi:GDP/UDP-N,N'-diacetylbacillosamine 2-epimerase (hydrolysing)